MPSRPPGRSPARVLCAAARQKLLQRLRHHSGDRAPRSPGMLADGGRKPHRQLDREHRACLGNHDAARPRRLIHIPAGLPLRTAQPPGQRPRGLRRRHPCLRQIRGRVDALSVLTTTSTTTDRHAVNVLLDTSDTICDTPRPFQPPVAQRDVKAEVAHCVGGVASPLLANVYLHYVLDLWADWWRKRHARGDVIIVRFADDFVVGFQYRDDAEEFQSALRKRFAEFSLELHPDKTRLIEFGRYAVPRRKARGEGKPETFSFLGFTHICAVTRRGRFWVRRVTDRKRLRAKLKQVKTEIMRRRHLPVPEQGRWLASVVTGHRNYYAVHGNYEAVSFFRYEVTRHWHHALKRRSQKNRLPWDRMNRLAKRWLPKTRITHPYPEQRFAASHPW